MKKYFVLVTLLCLVFFNSNAMLTWEIPQMVISSNKIERFPGHMVSDKQSYINGGLVFTYPPGLFTTNPVISVTLSVASPLPIIQFLPEISSESITSATVMVFKNQLGSLLQALTGEVTVHFMAVGT